MTNRHLLSSKAGSLIVLVLSLSLAQISFALELEISWSSDWSGGQKYPSPGPAINDIYYVSGSGWPGSELSRHCPDGDLHYGSYIAYKYCVRPEYILKDLSETGLLYKANYGFAAITHCGICPVTDQFGVQRCDANQTFWCGSEGALMPEINAYYDNDWRLCSHTFGAQSGWTYSEAGYAGAPLADGTALYYVKNRKSVEVDVEVAASWPMYSTCSDPTVPRHDLWWMESMSYKTCPTGYYDIGTLGPEGTSCSNHFQARLYQYGAKKEQTPGQCQTDHPCHPTTGVKSLNEPDFNSPTLEFTRHYQSEMFYQDFASMGKGWSHNYSERILPFNANSKKHLDGRGRVERYHCTDSPSCSVYRSESTSGSLLKPVAGGWELLTPGGLLKSFDAGGKLISLEDRTGSYRSIAISYSADDQVDVVMDQQGRSLQFAYNADGLVDTISLPSGEIIQYQYNRPASVPAHVGWNQQLVKVIREDLSERSYHYEDQNTDLTPRNEFLVTGITDEKGVRYSSFAYDERSRPVSSELAGGADRVTLIYTRRAGETEKWTITELTRPLGEVETYSIAADPFRKPTGISDSRGDVSINYDPATSWRSARTDREGNQTNYTYADSLHETRRTEAAGTLAERSIETDWDNNINRISERREPGKTTAYTFNARGQTLTRTETDTHTLATRKWTYSYHEIPAITELIGQLKHVDGPRTDVSDITSYDYYTSDEPSGMYLKGDLYRITNALGQVTEYLAYDGNGRPLQVKDANNVVTTMTYHPRGWIQSRSTDGQTTSFVYDHAGNLTQVSQPDGSFSRYEYDDAHRLDAIADNFNNRIEYTLDAAGNRTAEKTYNDLGVLKRQMSRVYDQLSRLQKIIDGNLDETIYGYDNNGNRISTQDPNLNSTRFEYDPLDRLIKTIDASLGNTLMAYDARDNLDTVTDPLGNTTTYHYDGLDNQTQLTSPDTGSTTYAYNAAGKRTAGTDARGVRVNYSYDALNRLTFTDYMDNSLDVTFTYDVGTNGKGRLTNISDAAGTETYSYDARGNLTSVVRVINLSSYTTRYAFNGADRLTQITYPSGMQVDYTLDAAGRIIAVDKTVNTVMENLVTGVVYEPFGPVNTFSYGNGLSMNASFDRDFELDQLQSGTGLDWIFGYDNSGNILTITDLVTPANNQIFSYDELYRLDTAAGGYGNENFDYDANGNRIRYINDMVDEPYTYQTSSNRMTTQNGWSFSRDAVGNRLDKLDGLGYGKLYSYGEQNRLTQTAVRDASGDTIVGTYLYDGRGQRVSKTTGGVTTHFIFGLNGELLSEHPDDGSADIEYVYFNGQPIAQISQQLQVVQPPGAELIMDNDVSGTSSSGSWSIKTDAQSYGTDYREAKKKANNTYRWTASPLGAIYNVYAWWISKKGFSKNVEYTVAYGAGQTDTVIKSHKNGGGQWQLLGQYYSTDGSDYIEVNAAGGKTSVDAIKWVEVPAPILTLVDTTSFIHNDHLGTPRAVTDNTQTVIWRWHSTPFGNWAPNEDPDGDGNNLTLNLRFPGQYYDAESELRYNYYRTYDPATGRYIESDPIGLDGGMNIFTYVKTNPLRYVDLFGLDTEFCTRYFYPTPMPYIRHCFVRYSDGGSSSFGPNGTGTDQAPDLWPKECQATKGNQNDDCMKREMAKCEAGQYDFTGFNCCHCVEQAMNVCGIRIPVDDWPNWPVNPGPQPGEAGYELGGGLLFGGSKP